MAYLQLENRYSRRAILRTKSRQVMGTALARQYAEERSEDSKRPNTSYIERLNLRKRMCSSLLRRRNPSPARKPERVQEALENGGSRRRKKISYGRSSGCLRS